MPFNQKNFRLEQKKASLRIYAVSNTSPKSIKCDVRSHGSSQHCSQSQVHRPARYLHIMFNSKHYSTHLECMHRVSLALIQKAH